MDLTVRMSSGFGRACSTVETGGRRASPSPPPIRNSLHLGGAQCAMAKGSSVNGQKTWTSLGQHANMIFCHIRTDS
jgi:hypothetical protein